MQLANHLVLAIMCTLMVVHGFACIPDGSILDGDSMFTTGEDDDGGGDFDIQFPPDAPIIDDLPDSISYESLPIQGTAIASGTIIATSYVQGLKQNTEDTIVSTAGDFCLDFPMVIDAYQTIEIKVLDANGKLSDPAVISITQDGTYDPDPPDPPEPFNVAEGLLATASPAPDSGALNLLTDGLTQEYITISCGMFSYAYVWLDLEDLYDVSQISLTFGNDRSKYYEVYLTPAESPVLPTMPASEGGEFESWNYISNKFCVDDETPCGPATDDYGVIPTQEARFVGFKFGYDTGIGWFNFELAEIQVIGLETDYVTNPTIVPACNNNFRPW